MALWGKVQALPQDALEKVLAAYGAGFPIEIRHSLSQWIEKNIQLNLDPDVPQNQLYIAEMMKSLIQEVEIKAASLTNPEYFLTSSALAEAAKTLKLKYSSNPLGLFKIIKNCLTTEMDLVIQNFGNPGPEVAEPTEDTEINLELESLVLRTQETHKELKQMEVDQESLATTYHNCTKVNLEIQSAVAQVQALAPAHLDALDSKCKNLQKELSVKIPDLLQQQLNLVDKLKDTVDRLAKLYQKIVVEHLLKWKRAQQLYANGHAMPFSLNKIQTWYESMAELIWFNRQQIKEVSALKNKCKMEPPGVQDHLPGLIEKVTRLLTSLVISSLVVENQPPQVIKTNTRFASRVRLLIGSKLNIQMTSPVTVNIIREKKVEALQTEKFNALSHPSGELVYNHQSMEHDQAVGYVANFGKLQLKKIIRGQRNLATESVIDEKFALIFSTSLIIAGGEFAYQLSAISLPVVVVVHYHQESPAWGTIIWDNAFAEIDRKTFSVTPEAPWSHIAETLSCKFRSVVGRALSNEHLNCLATKVFRPNEIVNPHKPLTYAALFKEPLPGRNFTFWDWFYAAMKLTKEYLREPFCDGAIVGFMTRRKTEEVLSYRPTGTFLLRFSDSVPGGVTIAWTEGQNKVYMVEPFTYKDLSVRCLADRILDLEHLTFVYPELPKNLVFLKYRPPVIESKVTNNGYTKLMLVTKVPGWIRSGISDFKLEMPSPGLSHDEINSGNQFFTPQSMPQESCLHTVTQQQALSNVDASRSEPWLM